MSYFQMLVDKATRQANRNRFLVVEVAPQEWAVVRVGHRSGLSHVVSAKSQSRAHDLAEQLNDMFEEGMIY